MHLSIIECLWLNVIIQPDICTAGSLEHMLFIEPDIQAVELFVHIFIARQPNIHVAKPLVQSCIVRQPDIHAAKPLVHVFIVNQPNKHTTSLLGHMLVIVSSLNNPG